MEKEITQHDVDVVREYTEGLAAEQRLERRSSVSNFWKIICGLFTTIGFLVGILLTLLLYMPQIKINTNRIDTIEKNYPIQMTRIEGLLNSNSGKLDAYAASLTNHMLVTDRLQ